MTEVEVDRLSIDGLTTSFTELVMEINVYVPCTSRSNYKTHMTSLCSVPTFRFNTFQFKLYWLT